MTESAGVDPSRLTEGTLSSGRLDAFSDGVFAILITIMVLELRVPVSARWSGLLNSEVLSRLLLYVLSFVFLGIYWVNHHHMMSLVNRVSGGMLWANLHLLFWLSLIPFVTSWAGVRPLSSAPIAAYGATALFAGIAYAILSMVIIRSQGPGSPLQAAVGNDVKGKASVAAYALAVVLALTVSAWAAIGLFIAVALMWLTPDPRIERHIVRSRE